MSNYENYSNTANTYDSTREAFGYEVILGMLYGASAVPQESVLLDAGCGTGNYSAALAPHVGRIEAVDLNPQMLAVAQGKFARLSARAQITVHNASIAALLKPSSERFMRMFDCVRKRCASAGMSASPSSRSHTNSATGVRANRRRMSARLPLTGTSIASPPTWRVTTSGVLR